MIYKVNITDIEQALANLGGEAKAKEIQNKILDDYCNGKIPQNYSHEKSFRQTIQRKMEDYCPQAEGFDSSKKEGKFLRVGHGIYRATNNNHSKEFMTTEEVLENANYFEGAIKKIAVNTYERNPEARKKCIAYYGTKCVVCYFDFEQTYGELGKSFIHIHHLVPLSEIKSSYRVDPIKDLRPVCANCHAIIHRTNPALSLEMIKEALLK